MVCIGYRVYLPGGHGYRNTAIHGLYPVPYYTRTRNHKQEPTRPLCSWEGAEQPSAAPARHKAVVDAFRPKVDPDSLIVKAYTLYQRTVSLRVWYTRSAPKRSASPSLVATACTSPAAFSAAHVASASPGALTTGRPCGGHEGIRV